MHLLINSFIKYELKKVIEVGVGEGTLVKLAKAGMDVSGFDVSKKMVEVAKNNFKKIFTSSKISGEIFKINDISQSSSKENLMDY